ncbi:transporter substrate-binding domain-containing protein [Neptunicella marina]|uniref:Transporter substrate-binding domain-containing protein n=1 Tax=Neptunicella marina TaxID=2125989 RepID=A0A8J6IWR4_9ALTE|nr:transporter substrate-binding domain-containing protein [Neptunicella marina]MBC3766992.1 transporter substrate-binding domain-containing protein [Neptunicella marina]
MQFVDHIDPASEVKGEGYYCLLLTAALKASGTEYEARHADIPDIEQRYMMFLNNGDINVMWKMTSNELEEQTLPIRIPLLKGLLGYRLFVIRKQDQAMFRQISYENQLKRLTAIQGLGWQDVAILRDNQYKVETTSWYKSIYKMLHNGYFDYYPRSVIEANTELNQHSFDDLQIEQTLLIRYPTAVYFFVQKDNQKLASAIEKGLKIMQQNGQFDALLFGFAKHKIALQKARLKQRKVFTLDNPRLPETTPTDPALWY